MSGNTQIPYEPNALQKPEMQALLNRALISLMWISPLINPLVGQMAPPASSRRAGLMAYADGTNWNPGSGEGIYVYDGAAWDLVGPTPPVTDTDEKAKVSSNDTTAGYMNGKLVAGDNITLTENNDAGNETLTIASGKDCLKGQVFTADSTFNVPSGVTALIVSLIGAGGGGGGGYTSTYKGGGGGAGHAIFQRNLVVSALEAISVVVGVGGTGGAVDTDGGNGEDTTFGSYLIAQGGKGGKKGTASAHGNGGDGASLLKGAGGTSVGGNATAFMNECGGAAGGAGSSATGGNCGTKLGGSVSTYGGGGGASFYANGGDALVIGGSVGTLGSGGAGGGINTAGANGGDGAVWVFWVAP